MKVRRQQFFRSALASFLLLSLLTGLPSAAATTRAGCCLAILPLANQSTDAQAGKVLEEMLFVELMRESGCFLLSSHESLGYFPAAGDAAHAQLDTAALIALGQKIGVNYLLRGAVREYRYRPLDLSPERGFVAPEQEAQLAFAWQAVEIPTGRVAARFDFTKTSGATPFGGFSPLSKLALVGSRQAATVLAANLQQQALANCRPRQLLQRSPARKAVVGRKGYRLEPDGLITFPGQILFVPATAFLTPASKKLLLGLPGFITGLPNVGESALSIAVVKSGIPSGTDNLWWDRLRALKQMLQRQFQSGKPLIRIGLVEEGGLAKKSAAAPLFFRVVPIR